MNHKLLFLIPILAIISGVSVFALSDFEQIDLQTADLLGTSALTLAGTSNAEKTGVRDNVEIIVKDQYGKIVFYDTTHNKVVTHGENCAAKMLFGTSGGDEVGSTVCVGAINQGFNVIQLGESSTAVADTDVDLVDQADETGLTGYTQGTIAWTNSTTGSYSTVVISATFTNTGATETIREVGLFNSTTAATNGMYARAVVSDAVVANGDDITINWTFETGAATVP